MVFCAIVEQLLVGATLNSFAALIFLFSVGACTQNCIKVENAVAVLKQGVG